MLNEISLVFSPESKTIEGKEAIGGICFDIEAYSREAKESSGEMEFLERFEGAEVYWMEEGDRHFAEIGGAIVELEHSGPDHWFFR